MRFSLRLKFGILLAIFGILASGATGYYFYDASRDLMVRTAENDLATSAQVIGRRFTVALEEVADHTRLLANLPDAIRAEEAPAGRAEESRARLAEVFAATLATHPEYFQIRFISADHHGLERVRVDRDGNSLTRVSPEDLQEKAHFPYVFRTLRLSKGDIHLSKITINHEEGAHSGLGKPTLRVATPVVGAGGKALGVMVINVDLHGLFALLKTDLPRDYGLYLANEWGDFLIHPDPAMAFGFDQGRRVLLQEGFRQAEPLFQGRADAVMAIQVGETAPAGRGGTAPPSYAEGGQVVAFQKLPFGEAGTSQFVVVGLSKPLAGVLAETRALGNKTMQIVLGFSLLAMLLSSAVSRFITRHLNRIVAAVQRFSQDHVMSGLPLDRHDEIGLLARSFNDMRIEIQAHIAQLHDSRRQLDHLARHDTLTGLPNRMMFYDTLEHEMAAARRSGKQLAVFFIDLDRFKQINDSLGHAVGDEVLRVAARRLKGMVREVDIVARLGGDEFMVLLAGLEDHHHLAAIAKKIIDGVVLPIRVGPHELQVSASIGISLYPRDATGAADLVHKADLAMYQSKTSGRNAYVFFGAGEVAAQ